MKLLLRLVCLLLLGCGVSAPSAEQASLSYKQHQDYHSLEVLFHQLERGMNATQVQRLLGPPVYSPVEGQDYYASDRQEALEPENPDGMKSTVGIVVEYRDGQGQLTDALQGFWLGPIGE